MRQKKKPTSSEPIVSRRERELLDDLELIKREGMRITVAGFAKRNGYANKSALRHFPVLRRELSDYVAQFSKSGQTREAPAVAKYYEAQIERQGRLIERLKAKVRAIPQVKVKIGKLEQQVKKDSHEKKLLRGMLSTVIAFLSSSDFARARDLSARLEEQAKQFLEEDDQVPFRKKGSR